MGSNDFFLAWNSSCYMNDVVQWSLFPIRLFWLFNLTRSRRQSLFSSGINNLNAFAPLFRAYNSAYMFFSNWCNWSRSICKPPIFDNLVCFEYREVNFVAATRFLIAQYFHRCDVNCKTITCYHRFTTKDYAIIENFTGFKIINWSLSGRPLGDARSRSNQRLVISSIWQVYVNISLKPLLKVCERIDLLKIRMFYEFSQTQSFAGWYFLPVPKDHIYPISISYVLFRWACYMLHLYRSFDEYILAFALLILPSIF